MDETQNNETQLAFNLTKTINAITAFKLKSEAEYKSLSHKKFMVESKATDTESKTSIEKQMVSLLQTNALYADLVEDENTAKINYAMVSGVYASVMTLVDMYKNSKIRLEDAVGGSQELMSIIWTQSDEEIPEDSCCEEPNCCNEPVAEILDPIKEETPEPAVPNEGLSKDAAAYFQ